MRPRYLDRMGIDERLLAFALSLLVLIGCEIPIVPTPDPVNPPDPVVVVPPVTDGLRVLIVEETAARRDLPTSQLAIFTSAPFRKFLAANNVKLRIWDDEVDAEHESDAAFRKLLEVPRASLPWLVIGGAKPFSGPLPTTVEETQAVIASHK